MKLGKRFSGPVQRDCHPFAGRDGPGKVQIAEAPEPAGGEFHAACSTYLPFRFA